ncbi:Hypothetical protein Ccan_12410 [Capnocytophaga canimorsus Cc5]|uniref:Uncharacterized protein n=1 Tax=Capnocytophaga canimorsus (strain 5) TaxID=860228 RepID=F9YPL1_CAPCC|nr:Hypothetical protein Ccan_12410 [Capnocytophaga canimorsus Cc5]
MYAKGFCSCEKDKFESNTIKKTILLIVLVLSCFLRKNKKIILIYLLDLLFFILLS